MTDHNITMQSASEDTIGTRVRETRDARKITYELKVIQQPHRARACGQGAKSSSDRRPVDPPPIVQLLIWQGDGREKENDITFSLGANFFVYATLENGRPPVPNRTSQPVIELPVLTGTSVAGISFLERPHPAGYFIFPDLSVRHEGKYKLKFTLYEEVKDPKDAHVNDIGQPTASSPASHFHGRCEVYSAEFLVFSAKKFPGLHMSTTLSRTVADQGCRVRIRRDVRMRSRKGQKELDCELENSDAMDNGTAPQSPDNRRRPRSARQSSPTLNHSASVHRTAQDQAQQYHQQNYPHPYPYHSVSQHPYPSPMGFEQAQQMPYQAAHYMQAQSIPPSPHQMAQFQHCGYQYPPQAMPPHFAHMHQQAFEQPQLPHGRHYSGEYQDSLPPNAQGNFMTNVDAADNARQHVQQHSPWSSNQQIAKLEPEAHASGILANQHEPKNSWKRAPPSQYVEKPSNGVGRKRSFSSTFDTQHIQEPLRSGARPDPNMQNEVSDSSEDELQDLQKMQITYKRADGTYAIHTPRHLWP